jgi:hypothetical protein
MTEDASTPWASAAVWHGDSVTLTARCAYYPTMEAAGSALPSGSVDAVVLEVGGEPRTLAVVEVKVEPNTLHSPKFMSVFQLRSHDSVNKSWEASSTNTSGVYRALISVPVGATCAVTKLST